VREVPTSWPWVMLPWRSLRAQRRRK
jgi:hypothetical protein